MAVKTNTVWAVDIGSNSLKAIHLHLDGEIVEVIGFDNIEHGKILTDPKITEQERQEHIAITLRNFLSRNDVSKDEVAIQVPSHSSFARFVKLPPVEARRIPEIVKFEAIQQIPFDINEVQWDWQIISEPGSVETKVGIFAIRNEVVNTALDQFAGENIKVSHIQMASMAIYNYILYDRKEISASSKQAIIAMDMGAENTDLVICTKSAVWQRCIPVGGNAFTRAISETFKLNFQKAEKLKRTAAMSKYSRQIFHAMRPVFSDLAAEVQRSLGFYTSSNPSVKFTKVIALGGAMKMRGLVKFLQQTIQVPFVRPDSFEKLQIAPEVSAAKFHDNVSELGIVYGLGLQALDQSKIRSNLLPKAIARAMAWATKAKVLAVAAAVLLVVVMLAFGKTFSDRSKYNSNAKIRTSNEATIRKVKQAQNDLEKEKARASKSESLIKKEYEFFKYRQIVPLLYQTIVSTLPNEINNSDDAELYQAFINGDVDAVKKIPRKERKQLFITSISFDFAEDLTTTIVGSTSITPRHTGSPTRPGAMGPPPPGGMPMPGGPPPIFRQPADRNRRPTGDVQQQDPKAGFIVTIEGYSPYGDISELLDPASPGKNESKWGFITRLMHLDKIKINGKDCPFELYGKSPKEYKADHFKMDYGEVDPSVQGTPKGIGVAQQKKTAAAATNRGVGRYDNMPTNNFGAGSTNIILIDPMTKETVSKIAMLKPDGEPKIGPGGKPIYTVNDHWFRIDAQFVWKDAPEELFTRGDMQGGANLWGGTRERGDLSRSDHSIANPGGN